MDLTDFNTRAFTTIIDCLLQLTARLAMMIDTFHHTNQHNSNRSVRIVYMWRGGVFLFYLFVSLFCFIHYVSITIKNILINKS